MINNPQASLQFRKIVEKISPVSDEEFNHLLSVLHEETFDKGEVILREGQVCRRFYFIIKGCIRSFGLEDGKETNLSFFFEDEFACNFASYRDEQSSESFLVAMEDCEVFYGDKMEANPVFDSSKSFHTFLFRFFQERFFEEEEHSNTFKLLSPEERYKYLIENGPHYLQRIPLIQLASYLGMSRETLSRIRKKIN